MRITIPCRALAITVISALGACADGDYATVRISYPPDAQPNSWQIGPSSRQRIINSFWKVAKTNGYRCHAHAKRVEEITCRGPKDMHITFKPALSGPEFVATFNWLELGDRTADEFKQHVSKFTRSMASTVNDRKVQLAVTES